MRDVRVSGGRSARRATRSSSRSDDTQPLVVSSATLAAPPSDLVIVTDRASVTLGAIRSQRVRSNDSSEPESPPRCRRSVSQRGRARTLHPHLGITLWTISSRAVDERGRIRGQLVDRPWTTPAPGGLSTGAPPRPRPGPDRHPHDATPCELPRSAQSTPSTGPFSTAGYLFLLELQKNNVVDGGSRPLENRSTGTPT